MRSRERIEKAIIDSAEESDTSAGLSACYHGASLEILLDIRDLLESLKTGKDK